MNEGVQLNAFPPGEGGKGLEEEKTVMRLKNSVFSPLGRERGRNKEEEEEVKRRRAGGLAGPRRVKSIFNFGLK